jgi:hypothetical protein
VGVVVAASCCISHCSNILVGPGSNAVTYFTFRISTEMKIIYQASIYFCQMFKKAWKSHTHLPLISSGVEVRKPMKGKGALEASDRMASMLK